MKFSIISKDSSSSSRLILFFAGWAMDSAPFRDLRRKGYDLMLVWDYREIDFSNLPISGYSEIVVVGWSFGVVTAASFISRFRNLLPITRAVAVGGTLFPVDDLLGIPEVIFLGTISGLSERNLRKFYRRMCASGDQFRSFIDSAPLRDIDELKEELIAISSRNYSFDRASSLLFDAIYVPDSDLIIPTANQNRAWRGHPCVKALKSGHLPDFDSILLSETIDKTSMVGTFSQGAATYDRSALVQHRVSGHLLDLWKEFISGSPKSVLEVGVGTGGFTRLYSATFSPERLLLWDIADLSSSNTQLTITRCDAEVEICRLNPGDVDAVVGASAIQWFNSPLRFIERCYRLLPPGGVCAFSTYGPRMFHQLSRFHTSRLNYLDVKAWKTIAGNVFDNPADEICISDQELVISFGSPKELLSHLRNTGVNAGGSAKSIAALRELLGSPCVTDLTYHPIYILLRKGC